MADVNTKFVDIQIRDLPQLIMCEPDEFDAKWDAFVAALDELPISVFENYMQEQVLKLVEANTAK